MDPGVWYRGATPQRTATELVEERSCQSSTQQEETSPKFCVSNSALIYSLHPNVATLHASHNLVLLSSCIIASVSERLEPLHDDY